MNQTSYELCVFEKDYQLNKAWEVYQMVLEAFKKAFNYHPVCELYVGIAGEKETQRSIITLRWIDTKGAEDAQRIVNLYTDLIAS